MTRYKNNPKNIEHNHKIKINEYKQVLCDKHKPLFNSGPMSTQTNIVVSVDKKKTSKHLLFVMKNTVRQPLHMFFVRWTQLRITINN